MTNIENMICYKNHKVRISVMQISQMTFLKKQHETLSVFLIKESLSKIPYSFEFCIKSLKNLIRELLYNTVLKLQRMKF